MMYFILLHAFAGTASGAVLVLLSFILPRLGLTGGEYARLEKKENDAIDPGELRHMSRREATMVSTAVHLFLFGILGAIYGMVVRLGIAEYAFLPLFAYVCIATVAFGGIIFPLEGSGFFGWKKDHWIAVDLFVMNCTWVLLYWMIVSAIQ